MSQRRSSLTSVSRAFSFAQDFQDNGIELDFETKMTVILEYMSSEVVDRTILEKAMWYG